MSKIKKPISRFNQSRALRRGQLVRLWRERAEKIRAMRADGVKLVDIARRFEISVYSVKDALAGRERAAGVRIKPDAGEVRRLYAEEGLEIGAIAQKLGCSIPTAKKALGDRTTIERGVNHEEQERIAEILRRVDAGEPRVQIQRAMQCSWQAIIRLIAARAAGQPLRLGKRDTSSRRAAQQRRVVVIKELVSTQGVDSVAELSRRLGVGRTTVRADLSALAAPRRAGNKPAAEKPQLRAVMIARLAKIPVAEARRAQVEAWHAEGLTVKEIAQRLGGSPMTVRRSLAAMQQRRVEGREARNAEIRRGFAAGVPAVELGFSMAACRRRRSRTTAATAAARAAARTEVSAHADRRARAILPILVELRCGGTVTLGGLVDELVRREIPTARGRRWHATTVRRILARRETAGYPLDKTESRAVYAAKLARCAARLVPGRYPTAARLTAELARRGWLSVEGGPLTENVLVDFVVAHCPEIWARFRKPGRICRGAVSRDREQVGIAVGELRRLIGDGMATATALADEMNRCKIPTPRGGAWSKQRVIRLLNRADPITGARLAASASQVKRRNLVRYTAARAAVEQKYAAALKDRVARLIAEGFDTVVKLRDELNRIGGVTYKGREWTSNSLGMHLKHHCNEIYDTILTGSSSRFDRIKRRLDGITRQGVVGATEIAVRLNEQRVPTISGKVPWNRQSVAKLLRRLGRDRLLRKPPFWTEERVAFAVALRQEGRTKKDIAQEFSVSVVTIDKVLRRALGPERR